MHPTAGRTDRLAQALRGESVSTEEHGWISAAPDVCFATGWALKRRSRSAVDVCVPNLLACPPWTGATASIGRASSGSEPLGILEYAPRSQAL